VRYSAYDKLRKGQETASNCHKLKKWHKSLIINTIYRKNNYAKLDPNTVLLIPKRNIYQPSLLHLSAQSPIMSRIRAENDKFNKKLLNSCIFDFFFVILQRIL
jgi:hypothetical protein